MPRTTNTTPVISRSPIARSSVSGPGLLPVASAEREGEQGQGLSISDALDAYKIYNKFSGGGSNLVTAGNPSGAAPGSLSNTGLLASKGGLSAVPGGAGYGTAAGGAAHSAGVAAVPGGLSNAAVSGGGSSLLGGSGSGLMGGKGAGGSSGGMMGGMGAAALPLAVFGIPYMWARSEEAKHDKQLAKLRAELGPEEVARRNAVAREEQTGRQQAEAEEAEKLRKLQESDSE